MEKVIKERFYHIHRTLDNFNRQNKHSGKWVVGNTICVPNLPEDKNSLFERVSGLSFDLEKEKRNINHCFHALKYFNQSTPDIQNRFLQNSLIGDNLQLVRELILENVRLATYPDHPSRMTGIWLASKQSIKDNWQETLGHINSKTFLVELTGKIHRADARWIVSNTLSFETYFNNAIGYWNGVSFDNQGKFEEEYICEGTLKVISEVDISE